MESLDLNSKSIWSVETKLGFLSTNIVSLHVFSSDEKYLERLLKDGK
jgi:hypothetical protein